MKNKGTLIVAVVLVFAATALMANSNWVGTFTGDHSGNWKGTLNPTQDPCFEGVWEETSTEPPDTGFLSIRLLRRPRTCRTTRLRQKVRWRSPEA